MAVDCGSVVASELELPVGLVVLESPTAESGLLDGVVGIRGCSSGLLGAVPRSRAWAGGDGGDVEGVSAFFSSWSSSARLAVLRARMEDLRRRAGVEV